MDDANSRADDPEPSQRRPGPSLRDACIAVIVSAVLVLQLCPLAAVLPGIDVDMSWPYTLADATARHLAFGRDIVFTFGPLSSIYTRFFLPDQGLWIFTAKAVLVAAFCLAATAMSRRPVRWAVLALPLLVANFVLSDPFYLVAPWIIVPLATASWPDRRWHSACLLGFAFVLGPLLLVKGSLAVPLVVSIGAAALVLARRSWIEAAVLPCAALVGTVVAWLATGQHLLDLPFYLKRESYVAGGYTDAMSSFGDPLDIAAFLVGAAVLLGSQFFPRRGPLMPTLAAAAILFVAFKSGFVRHDVHSTIAGGTLAMLGLLLFLHRGDLASGTSLAACLAVAGFINVNANFWPVDPISTWDRAMSGIDANLDAMRSRLTDPDAHRRAFEASKAKVAETAALPPTTGTVDLYPNDQEILLASNRDYDPRPVIQSYSAYTPELAFLNADHLEGTHAPQTVFFDIAPIDDHYPAMDDGPSWPALLGLYRFRTYSDTYAVLDRAPAASAGTIGPTILSGTPRFGDSVTVPQAVPFVWVRMQFHPTLLGQVASALFKMPLVHMDVTTANGQTSTFRLVPGMASAGFLLSPSVTSANDFVSLRSTATDALAGQRVTAIRLHEDGGFRLWGASFAIQFAALQVPTDSAVDDAVLGRLESGPPAAGLPASGACAFDTVGGAPAPVEAITVKGSTLAVTGWGFVGPAEEGRDGGNLRVALTPEGEATAYAKAERQARPDVDAYFHLSKPTRAGFSAQVNVSSLKGPAQLRVVQDTPMGTAVCGPVVEITR